MDLNSNNTGALKVSQEVVEKIARLAAGEVEGVALDADGRRLAREEINPTADKLKGLTRPVRVKLFKEAAEIDISVVALQGFKAAVIGENIQKAIKAAVQNMAGITVSKVNVRIVGIRLAENG
jgi:uncharacterized alkaline shock family protein YloU